jgi:hypothetical protein
MVDKQHYLNSIDEIKTMMEKSSRFLSLSGLSGIFAGIFAIFGAMVAYVYFGKTFYYGQTHEMLYFASSDIRSKFLLFIFLDAATVLILALISAFYFTWRKAKKKNIQVWNSTTKRMLINLFIPLFAGGFFGLILLWHGIVGILPSITLIFYGLALINASHYTFSDIRFLGISEIILGLIAAFFIGYGLFFWMVGFGVLHILYGAIMFFKYDKN